MKPKRSVEREETRAETARRRLAQLAASFDADLPAAEAPPDPARPRVERPHVRALAVIAVAALVLLVWWMLSGRPQQSGPVAPLAFSDSAGPASSSAPAPGTELIVDVVGKVKRPGIVAVPQGARVFDAIEAAGGLSGTIEGTSLNMARPISDGEQIVVGVDPVGPQGGASSSAGAASGRINLNTASAEELQTLPGVGPKTAESILAWRREHGRFATIDELIGVKGIGDATLAELRDLVGV